jgi:S-adenosylmethionine decarboxylase
VNRLSNKKLKLYGFNNLTKTLSFNIYDISYTNNEAQRKDYIEYIDDQYNSERLTSILKHVAQIINANILSVSKQDYDPLGASVTILIAEGKVDSRNLDPSCNLGVTPKKESVVTHLDKSHLTVHTYPETHPNRKISTFRVDIEVSTCGKITPLKALDYLISCFDSDVITMDYRVRGFTRDVKGEKHFIDHELNSIGDYINKKILNGYKKVDINLDYNNVYHTKLMLNKFNLNSYLFNITTKDLKVAEIDRIKQLVNQEMVEIFNGTNFPKMK